MALDPSIFFQGAALQQANAARTQQTIQSVFDKLAARQQREQELERQKATDYEGSAYRVLMAQQAGVQPDPQDLLRAKAFDAMRTSEYGLNPETGEPYPKNRSLFDGMAATPVSPMGAVDIESLAPMDESQLTAQYPRQANVPLPPRGGVDMGRIEQARADNAARVNQPAMDIGSTQLPLPENTKQKTKYYEAQLDVAKEREKKKVPAALAEAGLLGSLEQSKNLDETINEAINMTGPLTAGFASQFMVAGTPAANLKALLDTIGSDAAFSTLQQIRDSSPTGGALGAVSEKELDLLKSSVAAIQQAQSPGQLKKQLQKYKLQRAKSIDRVKRAYEQQYGELPSEAVVDSNVINWEDLP